MLNFHPSFHFEFLPFSSLTGSYAMRGNGIDTIRFSNFSTASLNTHRWPHSQFLIRFPVMPALLAWRSLFENHCCRKPSPTFFFLGRSQVWILGFAVNSLTPLTEEILVVVWLGNGKTVYFISLVLALLQFITYGKAEMYVDFVCLHIKEI